MSRTHRSIKYRPMNKEGKWARRMTNDDVRYHNRDLIKAITRNELDPDEVPFHDAPRTSGWETW